MNRIIKVLMGLATVVLMCFASSSCSKEKMNEKNIVGKWQSTSVNAKLYESDKLVTEKSENCTGWYIGFNFKSNGNGQLISYEETGVTETSEMTWVIMGEKLMITSNSETVTLDIIEIKNNSMTLSITEEEKYNNITYKTVATIYFSKM